MADKKKDNNEKEKPLTVEDAKKLQRELEQIVREMEEAAARERERDKKNSGRR